MGVERIITAIVNSYVALGSGPDPPFHDVTKSTIQSSSDASLLSGLIALSEKQSLKPSNWNELLSETFTINTFQRTRLLVSASEKLTKSHRSSGYLGFFRAKCASSALLLNGRSVFVPSEEEVWASLWLSALDLISSLRQDAIIFATWRTTMFGCKQLHPRANPPSSWIYYSMALKVHYSNIIDTQCARIKLDGVRSCVTEAVSQYNPKTSDE